MLPRAHRLRRSAEFDNAVRRGVRAATPSVVLHSLARGDGDATRVGFVVSRAVGGAATRNLVKRRLRALSAERLAELGVSSSVVVRANPAAATAPYAELGRDLDTGLRTLERRRSRS